MSGAEKGGRNVKAFDFTKGIKTLDAVLEEQRQRRSARAAVKRGGGSRSVADIAERPTSPSHDGVFGYTPPPPPERGPHGEDYRLLMVASESDRAAVAWRLEDLSGSPKASGVFLATGKHGSHGDCAEALPGCLALVPEGSKVSLLCTHVRNVFPKSFGGRGYLDDWREANSGPKRLEKKPHWLIVSGMMATRRITVACCPDRTAAAANELSGLQVQAREYSGAEGFVYESPADQRDREFKEALERDAEPSESDQLDEGG